MDDIGKAGNVVSCVSCGRPAIAGAGIVCVDDRPVSGRCGGCGGADAFPEPSIQGITQRAFVEMWQGSPDLEDERKSERKSEGAPHAWPKDG